MDDLRKSLCKPPSELLHWTFLGTAFGCLYGAWTATMYNLINTPTARRMLRKSMVVFGGAGFMFGLTETAIRHADPRQEGGYVEAGLAGCSAGVAVGLLTGSVGGGVGTCAGLAALASMRVAMNRSLEQIESRSHENNL